jgi:hypothetical protein
MVDLQIPSPYFWNFLQVFCKSILTTKSISSRTEKLTGEIGQNFNITFFKNIDLIDFKRFFVQKIEKIKTQKKPIISDRLAPLFDERCNYNTMIEYVTIRKLFNNTTLINLK